MADLLGDFSYNPGLVQDNNELFSNYFWGEKNLGFGALYQNMKCGQNSVKALQEFIKESAAAEDLYAKHLTKIAKQASSANALGTFAPMFEVLRGMSEKLSSCHMDVVHKFHDIVKDLGKYLEEQKGKHKQIKDTLTGTEEALHLTNNTTVAVGKAKEKYQQLFVEVERAKKANSPPKELEKAESKLKKATEDYRSLVDKHTTTRGDFQTKMTASANKFQEIEVLHLAHMQSVLESYILSFENANVLVNQVHQEFKRQVGESTSLSLIKQYCESKGTGTEKPATLMFEECDSSSVLISVDNNDMPNGGGHSEEHSPTAAPSKITRLPLSLNPFQRTKKRTKTKRKKEKDSISNSGSVKDSEKDTESIESPEKDSVKIDEEGYTIRPNENKHANDSWSFDSSDGSSDSDSDVDISRKINVKINPKTESNSTTADSNLDVLNAITRNLTLSSPTPMPPGKRLSPSSGSAKTSSISSTSLKEELSSPKTEKSLSDELLDMFSPPAGSSVVQNSSNTSTTSNHNAMNNDSIVKLFQSKSTSSLIPPPSQNTAPPKPATTSLSEHQLSSLFDSKPDEPKVSAVAATQEYQNHNGHASSPPLPVTPAPMSAASDNVFKMPPPPPPRPKNTTTDDDIAELTQIRPSNKILKSSESWSSLPGRGTMSPVDSFASSRGPSPLTLTHGDDIPIAVAFTESVSVWFKGSSANRECLVKIGGEVQMSFPAGIVRAFTSNPNPPILSFKISGSSSIENVNPNPSLIHKDSSCTDNQFWFNMPALTSHVKQLTDANPNASYYNVPVLSYQMSSVNGPHLVPLHLSSKWSCTSDATDISIEYKYNSSVARHALKNFQVLVPVDGGVIDLESSSPAATWIPAENRLRWKLNHAINRDAPTGKLSARLKLAGGPSKATTLGVQFISEGSTLTGSDFELTGSGYRVSLVKKRYRAAKYLETFVG